MWDPAQYQRYSDERSRPFFELLARVHATSPRHVVDLGCGPGDLTAVLAGRWPDAQVDGIDNSPQMLEAAQATLAGLLARPDGRTAGSGSLTFHHGDVSEFAPAHAVDVIVCNAVLQWIPGHRELLPRWAGTLSAGGWLAFQVPGNFDQPSHQILRDLAGSARWRAQLAGVAGTRQTHHPGDYLDLLACAGYEVDAWESTYLHVLHGDDPVLDWYMGSALRPVIAALAPGQAAEFVDEYARQLRAAYPARGYGTVLPFRRVFVVARRSEGAR
jgi:trans-aconitate 2-methyltransferase